jgi:hypothetical protein
VNVQDFTGCGSARILPVIENFGRHIYAYIYLLVAGLNIALFSGGLLLAPCVGRSVGDCNPVFRKATSYVSA